MNDAAKTVRFEVVFRGTFGNEDLVVGTYSTRKRARSAADRKDMAHGCYAHIVREVQA